MYPRVMIAGVHSGVGKTTVTLGVMAALRRRRIDVQPFKVGPDYIDPGLHFHASGNLSHNLDSWMGTEQIVTTIFCKHAQKAQISVIEGVMGLFDGAKGEQIIGSSAHIAMIVQTPVILVVNVKGMGRSCLALIKGYMEYQPGVRIQGVILNHGKSDYYRLLIKQEIEQELGIPVVGCLGSDRQVTIPERHLGLLPAEECSQLHEIIEHLADKAESELDIEAIIRIANSAPDITPVSVLNSPPSFEANVAPDAIVDSALNFASNGCLIKSGGQQVVGDLHIGKVKIGVAKDEAFNFYYADSLDYLRELGAELSFFSPIHDKEIPDVDGLYIGGGFPESFLQQLSGNRTMIESICQAHERAMPILAECGGMMYLAESIADIDGQKWDGCGILPIDLQMSDKLVALGYIRATSETDNIIANKGDILRGHEFHYSKVIRSGVIDSKATVSKIIDSKRSDSKQIDQRTSSAPCADWNYAFTLQGGRGTDGRQEGYSNRNLCASYLHLHFRSNPKAAAKYMQACANYRDRQMDGELREQEKEVKGNTLQGVEMQGKAVQRKAQGLPEGFGYTTGTSAAVATRAALELLVNQLEVGQVQIELPNGMDVIIPIEYVRREGAAVVAGVIKDAGNDPDVTHNMVIEAKVESINSPDVVIIGGIGVGKVTKPGLSVSAGQSAINPVPMQMIRKQVEEVLPGQMGQTGIQVTISVPGGEEIANKTLNPKLGIIGGISIIGTMGIVRPMSDEAYLQSLIPQIDQAISLGHEIVVLTPGGMGERMANKFGIDADAIAQTSNFIGAIVQECVKREQIKGILLFGHIGKLIKVAAGIFHTHSKLADARRETLAAHAAMYGAPQEAIRAIMELNTVDAGREIIEQYQLQATYKSLAAAASKRISDYARADENDVKIGTVMYALNGDILGYDQQALELGQVLGWKEM